jgi:alpha-D-xyloside xylohydrolase
VTATTTGHVRGTFLALALIAGLALAGANRAETIDRNGASVSIEAYAPNIVRVTLSTRRADAEAAPGYGVLARASASGFVHTTDAAGDRFRSPRLDVEVAPATPPFSPPPLPKDFLLPPPPVRLKIADGAGVTLLDMTGWEMAPHTVMGEKTFRIGATFASPDDEHDYGLGQNQEGILDLRGRTIDCRHDYDAPAGETVCVPFMVTNKGYGIVWDNPSDTHVSPGLNGRTIWQSQVGERVSFFVIAGKTPDEIYAGYRLLTGATPIPPKAAFGYIQSKQRYETQAQVLAAADGYRKRGYPADVMVIDWFYWTKMGQFDMNPAQWPDPAAMNRTLHDQGFQTIISVWPRFESSSRFYDTMAKNGWFLKNPDGTPTYGSPLRYDISGALIDSTNLAARNFYWNLIWDNFVSKGFDGIWLDETEPDLVPDGSFFSIGSGLRYHNLFPLLHTQGVYEGMRRDRPEQRGLILARAAYLGSQRNGDLFWSSDIFPTWDALKRQVPTGLNFTASGLAYWGNDIGGWQWLPATHKPAHPPLLDPSDARDVVGGYDDYPELFTRWFEYGAFLPTMRVHGSRKQVEIWAYGKAAEPILAKYLKLRYALMPYIYSLGHTTYETGAPFMRALWMDFPADPAVSTMGDEYMFGPAFLVAPVTDQGATSRPVYLPAGTDWYDWWTGARLKGGHMVQVKAPIDTLPLFVRAGSIVPVGEPVQNTMQVQKLAAIRVFPGADGDFVLYDDDGRTYAYEKAGGFAITRLHWNDAAGKLEVSGADSRWGDPRRVLRVVGR